MNKETEKLLKINETIITSEQCKEHRTLRNDERTLLMNNIKIKEYIQHLEQKESILDKVIDKLKEIKIREEIYNNLEEETKSMLKLNKVNVTFSKDIKEMEFKFK